MLTLYIGNKNYSSWSLRPWLVLRHFDIPFEEVLWPLYTQEGTALLKANSPNGKVPLLQDDALKVWDSLAIIEYLADRHPGHAIWPRDRAIRAHARAISAEMHSGFTGVRGSMPMDVRSRHPQPVFSEAVQLEIQRIIAIWEDCRARYAASGPWLFGEFSAADAMFAPVVWRFRSYGIALPEASAAWSSAMQQHLAMRHWELEAIAEPWTL
ncbi:glutathione S-transferase family protein [Leeia aquatica]|uniref:Glutathione S-transferase family protein n=1 Tax=Leeia aquatica TaxID=2725557 RepID=A0A847SB93_9NEIS|nr:glutathione S-transferase family protein [Leeia aquatica]NLR74609.1 glutathione S-transferase family protein [Leeia aquatica]